MGFRSARAILSWALCCAPLAACFEPEAPANTQAAASSAPARRFRIEHERCDASLGDVRSVDLDGDGSGDLVEVSKDGTLVCRASDLNMDGRPDVFEFFEAGQLRRRETNLLDASYVTVAETFEGGRLVLAEYDTKGQRRVDTWDHYTAAGKIDARERDTDADGKVDEWWSFGADGEVTVRVDVNADGEPDEVRRPDGVRR
jgi:hypothetical protein